MNFKVTGTPGEPVYLDTLNVGDWYVPENAKATGSQYPAAVSTNKDDYKVSVRAHGGMPHADSVYLLVHPLTRHEHDDGTVEFRHVGKEVKDDIRPIGELPVGTEIRYIEGEAYGPGRSERWSKPFEDDVRFVGEDNTTVNSVGSLMAGPLAPTHHVRVIAYPSDTCPACNGTGVKPAPEPEPTHLDRLPEAVREWIRQNLPHLPADAKELLARTIWEHRDAIFAAGEPVEDITEHDWTFDGDAAEVFVPLDDGGTASVVQAKKRVLLSREASLRLYRRGVAIALASTGGAQ